MYCGVLILPWRFFSSHVTVKQREHFNKAYYPSIPYATKSLMKQNYGRSSAEIDVKENEWNINSHESSLHLRQRRLQESRLEVLTPPT